MQKFWIIAATSAAIGMLPTPSFAGPNATDLSSQVGIEVGPGGVRVDDGHGRYRSERRRERSGRDRCAELRAACLNKERLGESGEGNCRRYRRACR